MRNKNADRARIFEILDQMVGKKTTRQIAGRLREEGLLDPPDEEAHYVRTTRTWIEQHGQTRRKERQIQLMLVNLYEVLADGTKEHYYKPCGQLTEGEAIQALRSEGRICRRQDRKWWQMFEFLTGLHGREGIETQLEFFPEHPDTNTDDGDDDGDGVPA